MAKSIELKSIDEIVKNSELINHNAGPRQFEYNLNDKNAKAKLLKGAKRPPFELIQNKGSINLIFNLGSWSHVVQPSILYWKSSQGDMTCKIGLSTVKILSVKMGTEANGKHVDTQIVFLINRERLWLIFTIQLNSS